MKKIILIALALVTIQVSAQERKQEMRKGDKMQRGQMMKDFTPKEMAQLQTKKMTLDLDLTEAQQKEIENFNLENVKERKAKMEARQAKMENGKGEKPSKEERFAMMNERLDKQMEIKKRMKRILNADQFEKWKKNQRRKHDKSKRKPQGKRLQKQ